MPFKSYLVQPYETTAEREIFDKVVEELHKEFDNKQELGVLIGNFSCEGKDIDAIFIKPDAIIIIDFKNYGGNLTFSENGDWLIGNTIVKGGAGGKNPYRQIKDNKFALLNTLNLLINLSNVNLGHITGIVVFHQPITFDDFTIPPKVKIWFHITDFKHFIQKVNQVTSPKIRLSESDIKSMIIRLNITFKLYSETGIPTNPQTDMESQETVFDMQGVDIDKSINEVQPDLQKNLADLGLKVVHTLSLPPRQAQVKGIADLGLSNNVSNFLQRYNNQVYHHQYQGLKLYNEGKNLCLATSTSSGKSDVFFMCGIDLLSQNTQAKILAVYPLKALGNQQEERWKEAIQKSELNVKVGRIDGSISLDERIKVLKSNNIIIITPDVIHSWLLSKLEEKTIKDFLKNLQMIVLDEVHTYTGVFGSNSSFLFRRLNHAVQVLSGKLPQFITASATVESPDKHLQKLTGLDFEVVDLSYDTSGKHQIDILLLDTYNPKDVLNKTAEIIRYFAKETSFQSITFLDSRKMVEQVATIVSRFSDEKVEDLDDNEDGNSIQTEHTTNDLQVYPYRSGYERTDAERIQNYLKEGKLKGVVSTSALEMGIDIKGLDLGILLGIPNSATSFYQRIGRIGRHKEGVVLIMNDHSVRSATIFKHPKEILNIPLAEGALYLENEYLQYIHTLCFASSEQEYDKISKTDEFSTEIPFSQKFIDRCKAERSGIVPTHLQPLKTQIEIIPHWTYPLRDLEPQFKVETKFQGQSQNLGSLSFAQVMREAYPHAVYYYMRTPYRVKNIYSRNKIVQVTKTMYYTTKPIFAPTLIFPNLTLGNIHFGKKFGDLKIVECNLQISESILGVKERRGNKEQNITYPFDLGNEGKYTLKKFTRNYFTSGVFFSHPILAADKIQNDMISQILYEVFLVVIPFEPQDIGFGKDKIRTDKSELKTDDKFVCVYDQTYGSLRLTNRLTELETLQKVFDRAIDLVQDKEGEYILSLDTAISKETINALCVMRLCLDSFAENLDLEEEQTVILTGTNHQEIILPYYGAGIGTKDWTKSKGVSLARSNEEFFIANLINTSENGEPKLYYRGYFDSSIKFDAKGNLIMNNTNPPTQVSAKSIRPFGESVTAVYDLELQDIIT
jgi:DEAD/DEAH box helicase domain-containing protein